MRIICLVSLLACSLVTANAATVKSNKTVVATIDGKNITAGEVSTTLWGKYGVQTIAEMISDRLLLDEAAKQKITVSDDVVEANFKSILNNRKQEDVEKELAIVGWTIKDLKKQIKDQLLMNDVVIKLANINVTDEDVLNAYNTNKDKLLSQEAVTVSQINIGSKEEAEKIVDSLVKGGDFAAISAEKSIDPALKENKGNVGIITRGRLPKELENEIFALRPGQFSKIIPLGNNYSIFKVTEYHPSQTLSYELVKNNLRASIFNQLINAQRPVIINKLRQNAKITIK